MSNHTSGPLSCLGGPIAQSAKAGVAASAAAVPSTPRRETVFANDLRSIGIDVLLPLHSFLLEREPRRDFPVKGSNRALAFHRDTRARAGVRPVIPHRAVLRAAIVPEGDRVLGPAEAALEQRILRVLVEIAQDCVTFVARNADDVRGEAAVDIKRLLPRHRMGAHDRM